MLKSQLLSILQINFLSFTRVYCSCVNSPVEVSFWLFSFFSIFANFFHLWIVKQKKRWKKEMERYKKIGICVVCVRERMGRFKIKTIESVTSFHDSNYPLI